MKIEHEFYILSDYNLESHRDSLLQLLLENFEDIIINSQKKFRLLLLPISETNSVTINIIKVEHFMEVFNRAELSVNNDTDYINIVKLIQETVKSVEIN